MNRTLISCFAAISLAGAPALADSVVHPTNAFPADVVNVQAAINAGGTVLLKATNTAGDPTSFNFGPPVAGSGFVLLTNNVTLLGELAGASMTTISGGNTVVRGLAAVRSRIHGIHFSGPRSSAISLNASSGAEISGNLITDVVGRPTGGITFGAGISIGSPAVAGDLLVVAGNVVNRVHAQAGYGISISGANAPTTISGNAVYGVNLNGILLGYNRKPASIVNNLVIPGPAQDADITAGNGILFGHSLAGQVLISNNTVICENTFADGIAVIGGGGGQPPANDSVVEMNDVTMHGSLFGGISLYDLVSSNLVRANKISGDGAFALQVGTFNPGEIADSNSFAGNNISQFNSTTADVFLEVNSQNTIFKGQSGTVIDLGSGNWVSGFSKKGMDENLGQRMRQAQAIRRLALTEAAPVDF